MYRAHRTPLGGTVDRQLPGPVHPEQFGAPVHRNDRAQGGHIARPGGDVDGGLATDAPTEQLGVGIAEVSDDIIRPEAACGGDRLAHPSAAHAEEGSVGTDRIFGCGLFQWYHAVRVGLCSPSAHRHERRIRDQHTDSAFRPCGGEWVGRADRQDLAS